MPEMNQANALGLSVGGEQEMNFLDSSFFKGNLSGQTLPTPHEVRELSGQNQFHPRPLPVRFDHLNLLVKFGPHVTITEAQSLCMIRRILGEEVPVPEVYGWRVDGSHVFIYMQLVRGGTLRDRWDTLSLAEKTTAVEDLRRIVTSLRQVEQKHNDTFIGKM